jgi:hypothetical protein
MGQRAGTTPTGMASRIPIKVTGYAAFQRGKAELLQDRPDAPSPRRGKATAQHRHMHSVRENRTD